MKNFKPVLMLLIAAFTLMPVFAKNNGDKLPVDSEVKVGKLKNGLTYYIRHNAKDENKAHFYIAQKVGSIQEKDHQRGLAHFLEHMCFNGTEKFPGNKLKDYLENIGVKFGNDLNAYTSIDETVYNINNVPVNIEGAIDSCLWILHDWADGLLLEEEEIDKERGVIHEEWRQRSNAALRMYDIILPIMYPNNSRYAYRMPIGIMEVVDNFPYEALREYYEEWYRPDLQGIIIVGDIDVNKIEKKIKKIFSTIKKAKNPTERVYFPVEDNEGIVFAHATDKEQQTYTMRIMFKHDATPREEKDSRKTLEESVVRSYAINMLNSRFGEIITRENPPYLGAGVGYGHFIMSATKEAFSVNVSCKAEQVMQAIPMVLTEVERARRYGFTESEFAREKTSRISGLDQWYAGRKERRNDYFVDMYVRNFLDNAPMMSDEDDYVISKEVLESVTLESVNKVLPSLIRENNIAIYTMAPEKEGVQYPGKNDIESLFKMIANQRIAEYVDNSNDAPLLAEEPVGRKIANSETGKWGETIWTFDGGMKVIVKPTTYAVNQVALSGYSKGGHNRYPDSDYINIAFMNSVAALGGLGEFNTTELGKKLAGKNASARVWATEIYDRVEGGCSPKDIETMLQLIYLNFTAPRMDSVAFNGYKTRLYNSLKDRDINPNTAFGDSLKVALYNNHPRTKAIVADDVEKIDYERIMEMYKDRTADASDYTFFIVGNVELETLKPLVEKYLGALPSIGRNEDFVVGDVETRTGIYRNNFKRKMEVPTGTEVLVYSGSIEGTQRNAVLMSILSQILNMVYLEEVREKEGGTYGVQVSGYVKKLPKAEYSMTVQFTMAPERREELTKIITDELEKMRQNGPKEEHLERVRSYMLKSYNEAQEKNSSWMTWLHQLHFNGDDVRTGYSDLIGGITREDIRLFLDTILKQGNMIEVSMTPEE